MAIEKKITDFRFKKKKQQGGWLEKQKKESKPERRRFLFFATSTAAGLLVGIVIFSIYKLLTVSEFFQITSIRIEGERRLSKQQIMELSGVTIRTNLLAMNAQSVKQKIEAHAWVEKAEVNRELPSDLVIKVKERLPVALLNRKKGLLFIDAKGVLFAPANPPEDLDYPIVTGLEEENIVEADSVVVQEKRESLKKALLFINYAGRGSSSLPRQNISEISITESNEFIVYLADRPFPIYMGTELSSKRYYRLAKVLYWLYKKREFSDVNFIRMDYINSKVLVGKKDAN